MSAVDWALWTITTGGVIAAFVLVDAPSLLARKRGRR